MLLCTTSVPVLDWAEVVEVFSLDVPAVDKAALWVAPPTVVATPSNIAAPGTGHRAPGTRYPVPGTFTSAQSIIVGPDGTYYTAFWLTELHSSLLETSPDLT